MNNPSQDNIFEHFPVIDLGDIILRQISIDNDYVNFFNYITHPEVTKYLSNDDIPSDLENAKVELSYWSRLFDFHSGFYWAIALKDSNKILGTCGFNHWNRSQWRAEISYDLDYNYWGNGIMTKAIEAITNFGLQTMKVQRIQATVATDNLPSIRVLEKAGFTRESLLCKYGVLQGESRDFYMYVKFI